FHHVFFARRLAIKGTPINGNGNANGWFASTNTGASDIGGNTAVIAFGGWSSTTPNAIAGTLLHELAHNFTITHKSDLAHDRSVKLNQQPSIFNCSPDRQGVGNYMYQFGLFKPNGTPTIDLSREVLSGVPNNAQNESLLVEASDLTSSTGALTAFYEF